MLPIFIIGLLLLVVKAHHPHEDMFPIDNKRILASSGDFTLPSSYFRFTGTFTVYYEFSSTHVTCAIEFNTPNQYVAFGFGNTMKNADVWVVQFSNGIPSIQDYWSPNFKAPLKDTDLGGNEDLSLLGYNAATDKTIIKFRRLKNTGDSRDVVINDGEIRDMIWATRSGRTDLAPHTGASMGIFKANWSTGSQTEIEHANGIKDAHGIVMFIVWGVLFDIAIFAIRILKQKKIFTSYLYIHTFIMGINFLLSTIFICLILA